MQFKRILQQYQWIVLGAVFLCVFATYVKLRFIPFYQDIAAQNTQLNADEKLLKNPNIPEEPMEDSEYLSGELDELNKVLVSAAGQADSFKQRLAPIDSQEVLLKISEVARTSRVKVVQNLPYLVQRRVAIDEQTGKISNKKLSKAEERKQQQKLRKQAKRARKDTQKYGGVVGALTREGELMDKLVNDFEEARPLQEVKVEGPFDNLKVFIEAIHALPWQVTIVKLDVDVKDQQKMPQGLPQLLSAKMIIGM